jgi:hypothetical protein
MVQTVRYKIRTTQLSGDYTAWMQRHLNRCTRMRIAATRFRRFHSSMSQMFLCCGVGWPRSLPSWHLCNVLSQGEGQPLHLDLAIADYAAHRRYLQKFELVSDLTSLLVCNVDCVAVIYRA